MHKWLMYAEHASLYNFCFDENKALFLHGTIQLICAHTTI